jgi:hypothetical protein
VSCWSDRSTAPRTWTAPIGASVRDASTDTGTPTFQALVTDSNGPVPAGSYGALTATTDASIDRAAIWTIILNVATGSGDQPTRRGIHVGLHGPVVLVQRHGLE